jgi:GNAT superfamily N-acetyltransferase
MASSTPSPVLLVRTATIQDAESLAELSCQLGYPAHAEDMLKRLAQIERRDENAVYVAEVSGKVIGWVHIMARDLLESGRYAEIGGLVVDELRRGQGAGQALMNKAEEWAREHQCREIVVRSNVIRTAAHRFYERIGYRVTKSQKVFRKAT